MATSKSLSKRLVEFSFNQSKLIIIQSDVSNSPEIILPFLISQMQNLDILIFNFSDEPAHLIYLCKRVGLNLSKFPRIKIIDGLSILCDLVDSHYPLTKEPPFTHLISKLNVPQKEKTNKISEHIFELIKTMGKEMTSPVFIFNGLHFLFNKFELENENGLAIFSEFIFSILRIKAEKIVISFDKSIKKKSLPMFKFFRTSCDLEIKLKDLQNGFTIDYSGNIFFRKFDEVNMKYVKKGLKIIITNGQVDFSEQIKIN